jgi:hypothetical protein
MDIRRREFFKRIGQFSLFSLFVVGAYYFWKKAYKSLSSKLDDWHIEYINYIKELMASSKEDKLDLEIISHIFNLLNEVSDYLYFQDEENKELEERRMNLMGSNDELYEYLIHETIQQNKKYFEKAEKIIEKAFSIDLIKLRRQVTKEEGRRVRSAMISCRRDFPNSWLPKLTQETLREAYIYYCKCLIKNSHLFQEQVGISKGDENVYMQAVRSLYIQKYKLKDEMMVKYGCRDKYLEQLLIKYDLDKEPEVKYMQEQIYSLDVILE